MTSTISVFNRLQIPLEDILKATNNFADENIIGKGGFGNVYKGRLMPSKKLIDISARRLDRKHGQGDVEFWTEISVLANLRHKNIVRLIGYCDEKGEKIIVYRYYAKGSLTMHLKDTKNLPWKQRLMIAKGIARSLVYIHHQEDEGRRDYVIHRNINSSTFILDNKWKPKLSGFEFSVKHSVDRMNQVYLCDPIGTQGYMDPATGETGGVTHKSDIYSFGVILIELMSGRKASEEKSLARAAIFHRQSRRMKDIIHPDLMWDMDQCSLQNYIDIAYQCLVPNRETRPDAKQVMQNLYKAYREYMYANRHTSDDEVDTNDEDHERDEETAWRDAYNDALREEENSIINFWPPNVCAVEGFEHLRLDFGYVQRATNGFSDTDIVGFTKFASYFKVELICFDRSFKWKGESDEEVPKRNYTVKVERIHDTNLTFDTEIKILSTCMHPNIQSLVGFCDNSPKMILVYKYVSTNYLSSNLKNRLLTWEKRLRICIDVAYGLDHLNNYMQVIHGDINSKNIELDDSWGATITGFVHSVFLEGDDDDDDDDDDDESFRRLNEVEDVQESYMDPKYIETRKLKKTSDIFSFGAIMLEILCGMSIDDLMDGWNKGISSLAHCWFTEGTIKRKVSPLIKGENGENIFSLNKGPNQDSLDTFINIAIQCLAEKHYQRPTMEVVIHELEKALSFQKNNKDNFRISLEDVKLATQNFSQANVVGGGGFGKVYKGEMKQGNGNGKYTLVAKQLDTSHGQGEQQYYNELQILYEYKHENIIGLVGYSNETKEKIIVYEYAPKGSLDKYLNDANLTWRNRLKICIDFATGLDFLHAGLHGKEVVIHRDIKAANILLFDDWKAKVGDFGLSMISTVNKKADYVIDHACGTPGYLDPLYLKSGFLTMESDIYSFGVVLFEILCGRSTFETRKHDGQYLPSLIKHKYEEGKQDEMVFEAIKKEIVPESLATFQNIAYHCLGDDRKKRPKARQVLAQLKKALELQTESRIMGDTAPLSKVLNWHPVPISDDEDGDEKVGKEEDDEEDENEDYEEDDEEYDEESEYEDSEYLD